MKHSEIKVLQYVKVLERGGLESFVLNYGKAIKPYHITFDYLVTRDCVEPYEEEIKKIGSKKIVVNINDNNCLIKEFQTFIKLYKFFKSCGYSIVHFESITPSIQGNMALLAAKFAGVRIRIVHSHIAPEGWEKYSGLHRIKYYITKKVNLKLGTHFFGCSDLASKFAFSEEIINGNSYWKITNAINTSAYLYNSVTRDIYRKKLKIEDKIVIGHIARFVKQKNHFFTIEIMQELLKYTNNYILLLIGEKSDSEPYVFNNVKEEIKQRGLNNSVIFLGGVTNVNEYLNAMDIFLLPSFFEGLPISLIEAQASGLPCIVSDTVSKEAKLSEDVHYLSLSIGAKKWANYILHIVPYLRKNNKNMILNSGYDINSNAKKLADIYYQIAERD